MKRLIISLLVLLPLALLGNSEAHGNVETDILQRTVNFLIFAAIIYYLLADKIKAFLADRTNSIQAELDKVQDMVKESAKKVEDAKAELDKAKKVADELIASANADIEAIKTKIEASIDQEIENLSKSFDDKAELERRKVKREVVQTILEQLMNDDNIALSNDDLAKVILKKVA